MVNFGDCLVRSEGAIALAAVLREGLPVLRVSTTTNPSFFFLMYVSVSCINSLITCFQELNLSFGEITEAAALVVAQAVTEKPHIERVDLNGKCSVKLSLQR